MHLPISSSMIVITVVAGLRVTRGALVARTPENVLLPSAILSGMIEIFTQSWLRVAVKVKVAVVAM